ncbi:hypothetical protein FC652_01525 [Vibrio sp. 05-20-BW147]|uniref:hypothetical protein n=1 Tax=Vibrio sp. 05-20-BW147 TaxID=2575834 RepID=UPI001592F1BF|nr:hypothetical protein [Vibrio sp. 05-20-BW147]NVC61808.1 hypothetical protein [Vibrio sp. 05-20-BW147]
MALKRFVLPDCITIYEVTQIYEELVQSHETLNRMGLNGEKVEEIDTAGIQLLLWLNQQYTMKVDPCSSLLQQKLHFLGLERLIGKRDE